MTTINISALEKYMEQNQIKLPQLAHKLNIDYSYLYRIMRGEKSGGGKVISGLIGLCAREGLDIAEFIFLPEALSADNETSVTKDSA